jgi:hypothetical protein
MLPVENIFNFAGHLAGLDFGDDGFELIGVAAMDHQMRDIPGHRSIDVSPDGIFLKVHPNSHKGRYPNPTIFLNCLGWILELR